MIEGPGVYVSQNVDDLRIMNNMLQNVHLYSVDGPTRYTNLSLHHPDMIDISNGTQIAYGDDVLQKIKVFNFSPHNSHTIVLIHGGAWRDPNNTFLDFEDLVGYLLKEHNLIGVNYRLSPDNKHPCHIEDVVAGIGKIQTLVAPGTEYSFVGHSVGATLLLQLLNYHEIIDLGNGDFTVSKSLPKLDLKIRYIYFVDGIYDIQDLIAEYGAPYKLFVDCAFESEKQYLEASQMTWSLSKEFLWEFKAVVIQSEDDELLSQRQSDTFVGFLKKRQCTVEYLQGNWGKHEEVYRHPYLAEIIETRSQKLLRSEVAK